MKVKPIIRKSGKHWVIDRGPHKAMPCCETKTEAEQLLACSELWTGKQVSAQRHGSAEIICGRVAILYAHFLPCFDVSEYSPNPGE